MQKFKNVSYTFIHLVWEPIEHIRYCYYNVSFHTKLNLRLYKSKKKV